LPVDQDWGAAVGRAGAAVVAVPGWTLVANVDQGFRAPNLNDMTSRQQTGPGFQFENPDLQPERSLTTELGSIVDAGRFELGAWAYRTTIEDAMARRPAADDECPNDDCRASWFRYKLVNLPGQAEILGAEGTALARLPGGVRLRATVAYAIGDGQNPAERPEDPAEAAEYEERVPLSRIPPLNGTVEAVWRGAWGGYAGAGLRWATEQDRLAPQDQGDSRIPASGTPGFAVVDLRAGYRLERRIVLGAVLENLFDEAYRYHGSAVNGPGRGLVATAELGL
jgi:iron complex outermembrane receptor protein/hemoglobin/transferrin/lactoferrin receptor protein